MNHMHQPKHLTRLVDASLKPNAFMEVAQAASFTYGDLLDTYGTPQSNLSLEQADLASSTSGILNKVFGRYLYVQVNKSTHGYGALPKYRVGPGAPYAFRAKSALASSALGGQAEGTVPTAVVGTYKEISPSIKEHSTQMRVSGLQQDLAEGPDDAYGMLTDVMGELGVEHGKEFERALFKDIDTLASNNMESIDRATASSANQGTIGWTAADEDIHGVDRSTDTYFDAVQTVASTATTLTLKAIDTNLRTVHANGGNTSVIITGWDTWEGISDLLEQRGRYDMGVAQLATGTFNDADTAPGTSVTTFVGTYQGRPIVASDQVVADSNEISRVYGLDLTSPDGKQPYIGIATLRPTQIFSAGERTNGAPQSISFVGDSLLATTRHELVVRFPKAQWQLRDRTAP